jgi:hypothetical protein
MKDLIVLAVISLAVALAVGCGTAIAQYRAESPNYSLEYLEETSPSADPGVLGEEVEFTQQETTQPQAGQLPATNPPYGILIALAAAVVVAVVIYAVVK